MQELHFFSLVHTLTFMFSEISHFDFALHIFVVFRALILYQAKLNAFMDSINGEDTIAYKNGACVAILTDF